jgi:hypothetical protein
MVLNTDQKPSGAFDAPEEEKRPDSNGVASHDTGGSTNESEPSTRSKVDGSNDNTFRYRGKKYQIDLLPTDLDLKRRKVTFEMKLNGRMAILLRKTYYLARA